MPYPLNTIHRLTRLMLASLGFCLLAGCSPSPPVGTGTAPTQSTPATTAEHASQLEELAPYKKGTEELSGDFISKGSDSMSQLMGFWTEEFRKIHPGIRVQLEHKGSSDTPKALALNQATFGSMSRDWKPEEITAFEKAHGYQPTTIKTSIDMLSVFVHPDNPLTGLSLPELDAIFSSERKGGFPTDVKTWGDLGVTGEYADKPIKLYSRDSASGTYLFFKERALFNGTYKSSTNENVGSAAVIQSVAEDRYGIGYCGVGYTQNAAVKVLPLSMEPGGKKIPPNVDHAYDNSYPLCRFLYLSINQEPGKPVVPLKREFLKFVLSRDGQALVGKEGYIPLNADQVQEELTKLQLP
ncbi:MAG: phosphate ABC transporter substrate-binding protein [Pirellulales bacterium]|nr:phosphate ABC transporter substrate-binding protein [Pirellulales bacterium]